MSGPVWVTRYATPEEAKPLEDAIRRRMRAEHEREIAHAVAVEREAIAAYLEAGCSDGDGCFHDFIHAIREGAHNPQPTTSGTETEAEEFENE